MYYIQYTNEYFFKNITPCRCLDFAAGLFRALVHVCRAPRPRVHVRSFPGVAAPVPCALPRATNPGRPTACTIPPPEAAEPPRLTNMLTAADPPSLTTAQPVAEPQDPVRGQSSVAGDVNPRLGGALENDRGAGVDCDGIRNAPPRNAMACDVTIWGGSFL